MLKNILAGLFKMNLWEVALLAYKSEGREAAKRILTPPEKFVRQMCEKSGADPEKALEERDEAVEENLEFLESIIDHNFEDPD